MARRLEDLPDDPVLALIDDEDPSLSFDEWLALLGTDEPTEVDANAAAIVREIREHGEH